MKSNNSVKIRNRIIVSFIILVVSAGTFFCGFFVGRCNIDKDIQTLAYILEMYKKYYYEESDDIIGDITSALLDRYSTYYTKDEYDLIVKTANGQREGIGISYNKTTNTISNVSGNSPAKKAGIKPGGVIVGIGLTEETIKEVTSNNFPTLIEGIDANVDFILEISYDGKINRYNLQKTQYNETYVFYYDDSGEYGFDDSMGDMTFCRVSDNFDYPIGEKEKTAVIKYTGFSGRQSGLYGSVGQFSKALSYFKESGKNCLILDLRNNGGGYMDIFCSVSAHLINAQYGTRNLVAYAEFKDQSKQNFYSDKVDYDDYNFEKIIILANNNSASASEALMGAVLDYDKTNIVNVILEQSIVNDNVVYKSYGKGIMQTTYERPIYGDAIKLTTAKIYWPLSNTTIHGVGLTPSLDGRIMGESGINQGFYDAIQLCK